MVWLAVYMMERSVRPVDCGSLEKLRRSTVNTWTGISARTVERRMAEEWHTDSGFTLSRTGWITRRFPIQRREVLFSNLWFFSLYFSSWSSTSAAWLNFALQWIIVPFIFIYLAMKYMYHRDYSQPAPVPVWPCSSGGRATVVWSGGCGFDFHPFLGLMFGRKCILVYFFNI